MTTTLSLLNQFPVTIEGRKAFIERAAFEIAHGSREPIKSVFVIDTIIKTLEGIKKHFAVKQAFDNEVDKYPEKTIEFDGFSVTKASRTTWDYSHDDVWRDLKKKLEAREQLMVEVSKHLKPLFDSDGVEIPPAISKTTDFTQIKIK
jgi:hypothetical protein